MNDAAEGLPGVPPQQSPVPPAQAPMPAPVQADPAMPAQYAVPAEQPPAQPDPVPPFVPDPNATTQASTQNERLSDGVNRCPRCGSTEIQLRPQTGMLICMFCRYEWSEATVEGQIFAEQPLDQLQDTVIGTGVADIDDTMSNVVTLKCGGCGSEVVVNVASAMSARCHW